jgi:hypothetical protein
MFALTSANSQPTRQQRKVPAAPFVDKTDKWVALALKRVIKMAVDEGYDRVAFVTGEQSAARYDLSKHIDRIHYEKSEDGLYELIAYKIGSRDDSTGSEALHEDEIDLARIEELVGKDIAQKIADEAGDKIGGSYRDWRELKNVDLKVGGEGMKAFYDKIVPSVLKDVLKKVGGGHRIVGRDLEPGQGCRRRCGRVAGQPSVGFVRPIPRQMARRQRAAGKRPGRGRQVQRACSA